MNKYKFLLYFINKKSMSISFKLLTFNCIDETIQDDENPTSFIACKDKEYVVQMFGINEKGKTASITVTNYKPFFYILVDENWNESHRIGFIAQIYEDIGKYFNGTIISSKYVYKHKLYGFDAGKKYKFLVLRFQNEQSLKKVKNLWINYINKPGGFSDKEVISYNYGDYETHLYEGHVPPLLRLFHIKELSPSGWVALPLKKICKDKIKKTSCDYEITISYKHLISLPNKEASVPYKICSFDIEASSSHGDFPLPIKNYKKLAQNIIDCWDNKPDDYSNKDFINYLINSSFNFNENKFNVDLVYPKIHPTQELLQTLIDKFVDIIPIHYKNKLKEDLASGVLNDENLEDNDEPSNIIGNEGINENGENQPVNFYYIKKPKSYRKLKNVVELLDDYDAERETKLFELTNILTSVFPNLKGDIVTFIGSTFMKFGDKTPYLNHCIVRNTCDNLPDIKNCKIETYNSEKQVLLAWTNIIRREDPDIIIGYNIFGFDYNFMYLRAKELGITRPFLKMSRNKNEICLKRDWKTGKESIETSSIAIASGLHELKYIKMNGRIQIDLYNYLRRDYNLSQYKLDYVAGYFIGDSVKKIEHDFENNKTKIYTQNLTGLENNSFIAFEEFGHTVDSYKEGKKFSVSNINIEKSSFDIQGIESLNLNKKVKWGLAKDDVTPKDIFEMTNRGPSDRAVIAKYCLQDCNLVHYLLNKIDVITGFVEMAKLCSVPIDFIVLRGQGIKLTSYIAKKCRAKETLIPVLDTISSDEGYEGAIVLPPKCDLYLDDPVACLDYSSLYPSAMISENISQDSKVWTKEFDLGDNLIHETGEKDEHNNYIYDNLENYKYVNITYDLFRWQRKNNNPKAAKEKVKCGYKICRYAQFPDGKKGILPSILEECLAARKATRALIKNEKDVFMRNILDKRQLSIKITANSIYGQTGARTSTFYDKDVAASTTATGRVLLTYAKEVIEIGYNNRVVDTKNHGKVKTNAEHVYGDTDSVFFKFNLTELDGTHIIKEKALEITIELAQQAGELASKFLKQPHDLEYEKTFLPFCLLSKKRYVGMLYETDINKCYRKSMGIVLKRRDNAPVVKDVYGGIIDILMNQQCIETASEFLKNSLQELVNGSVKLNKLIVTKSLRSNYKNPKQIAHKVLAERIGIRDPGSKPSQGDRIPYAYIKNPDKKALQGDKIENPNYIVDNNLEIDYAHYITNQIMKPVQQVFGLVLEKMIDFKKKKGHTLRIWKNQLHELKEKYPDEITYKKKKDLLINKEVKSLLFEYYIKICK